MKKAPIFLMLMIAFFSVTSQTSLLPIKHDSLFCFTIKQSKSIAKYINNSLYCDTILLAKDKVILFQDSLLKIDKSIIDKQKEIIDNAYLTIDNTNKINDRLQIKNEILIKEVKKQKRQKNLYVLAAIAFGAIAIIR